MLRRLIGPLALHPDLGCIATVSLCGGWIHFGGAHIPSVAFLLFEEPAGSITIPADAPESQAEFVKRRNWNVMKFAEEYGLKLVGASFFLTEANEQPEK